MKVAVCFWGLTRSLKYTLKSIEDNIFSSLKNKGIEYDVFLHTYIHDTPYTNKRAHEDAIILDSEEWRLLNPTRWLLENQKDADTKLALDKYRSKGNPWSPEDDSWQTFENHIRSLWSLKQVTSLYSEKDYDLVIYLRPDMRYYTPLPDLSNIGLKEILIPDFHLFPVNDRFCIAKTPTAKIYGNRFDLAYNFSLTRRLHSERFLKWILDTKKVKIRKVRFIFHRVRANGQEIDMDVI